MVSYHAHSKAERLDEVLDALDAGDVALVTDAGAPGVSDPGARLVEAAAMRGHRVVSVPGPSAITAALGVSGLPADRFLFLGFLPRKGVQRRGLLDHVEDESGTLVCFEAPHRLRESLADIDAAWPERRLAVCRELTKLHEEVFRGTAREALEHFGTPRGEFVIVIEGREEPASAVSDMDIAAALDRLRGEGLRGRRLVDAGTAATGASRSRVYRVSLEGDGGGDAPRGRAGT
ncbi:MAG: rRNA small subunit methyltransferase 1, partial [Gemmatimonadetes bacterium]|nr:rRNA small subunit methyltransferase 1 [Gemmatimonadota bacterium]